jgi:probable F420-dependent oxidoreductase
VDIILGYDHFLAPTVQGLNESGRPVLDDVQKPTSNFEGWTALAAWAEMTRRAEIGLLVGGAGFRNPDLLADMARTVDHISDGRLILGLGGGWYEADYWVYGYDFGTAASRHEVLVDALERIGRRMPQLTPPPVRKIPVLIGGGGERRTIPTAARFADIWHVAVEPGPFARKDEVLRHSADAIGRDHNEIERAVKWFNSSSAEALAKAGATGNPPYSIPPYSSVQRRVRLGRCMDISSRVNVNGFAQARCNHIGWVPRLTSAAALGTEPAERAYLVHDVQCGDLVGLCERRVVEHRVHQVLDGAAAPHHRLPNMG